MHSPACRQGSGKVSLTRLFAKATSDRDECLTHQQSFMRLRETLSFADHQGFGELGVEGSD
jgi:hypothetical protein